ncbi:MAG: ABC transporter ATP-binding protein [Bacillota bacterium]
MQEQVLKLTGVSKSFQGTKAVDDVSFAVNKGEILGLLGPNGAGKTTTLRMIMDIISPDVGKIVFSGSGLNKKRMGYLPEERGLYQDARVRDTILYFAGLNDMGGRNACQEADNWLERLELDGYAGNKVSELSKGMQQKVQFVVSMIHRPEVLILDELFSGLDPVNQDLFKEIVRELVEDGVTILLSSHRMNMVEELCDRIFMIHGGCRVLYGKLREIKEEFGRRDVEMWIEGEAREFLQDEPDVNELKYDRERNRISFSFAGKCNIREFVASFPEEIRIRELSISYPDLHSIFVSTVKEGDSK